MSLSGAFNAIKSSSLLSWKSTGKLQQTIANCIEKTGRTLHSGKLTTVKIFPEFAGEGRYFHFNSKLIRASIDYAQYSSPLCTTLSKDDHTVRTVEHLLSALEASGVDNCRIEIINPDPEDLSTEVPIFDGSAREWVDAVEQVGLKVAIDHSGNTCKFICCILNQVALVEYGMEIKHVCCEVVAQ